MIEMHQKIVQLVRAGYWSAHFPDFKPEEFFSPSCLVAYPGKFDFQHFSAVQQFRTAIGRPVVINNWATGGTRRAAGVRSTQDNIVAGGATESQHKEGRAADLYVPGWTPEELFRELYLFGRFSALFIYDTFVHCDSRFNPLGPVITGDFRGTHKDPTRRRPTKPVEIAGRSIQP